MNLGLVFYNKGEAQNALTHFQLAEAAWQKQDDILSLARLNTNMGLVFLALQQLGPAEEAFNHSIAHYQRLKDDSGALNATDGLAMALLAQHRYADAIAKLRQGLADLHKIAHLPSYAYLLQSMQNHLQQAQRYMRPQQLTAAPYRLAPDKPMLFHA
ncbi:MAG: tetratricopeptide repeat protein [Caldilineaceae bacterium]